MRYIPVSPQFPVKTARYTAFRGVDLSADPTKVRADRSPYAPNLISDSGGFPEKRLGWRTLCTLKGPVNGIFAARFEFGYRMIAHGGDTLYDITEFNNPTVLRTGVTDARSAAFYANGRLWILTGGEYLTYNGLVVQDAAELSPRPVTSIGRNPLSGGVAYEDVNLLTPKRENRFLADGTSKKYQLDTDLLDKNSPVTVTVNGTELTEGTDFTVNRNAGLVTFTEAPAKPAVSGADNVFIRFEKTVEGAYEKIAKCTIAAQFGADGSGYVFLSGNPDHPATDFRSALRDPAYFPDNGYSLIGSEMTAVMGYARIGADLAVLKESDEHNSTVFLRSYALDNVTGDRTQAVFPLRAGISGVGMIAPRAVGYLADEPLFLSPSGVYAVVSNAVTAERSLENRSAFVDASLTKTDLAKAVCVEWNGRFLIAVDGVVYVLDGNQPSAAQNGQRKLYECFYWTDIPANCFYAEGADLFFGTADGRVCRFNTDIASCAKYSDDGRPILASWSTKADDDGDFMRYKRLLRSGCGVLIKPYARSGCTVRIRTENDFGKTVASVQTDMFDFSDVDFARLSFLVNDTPRVIPIRIGPRRYLTAQVIVSNDRLNEGFGVFGITRQFRHAGFCKK